MPRIETGVDSFFFLFRMRMTNENKKESFALTWEEHQTKESSVCLPCVLIAAMLLSLSLFP
jgi:hypothetical protein